METSRIFLFADKYLKLFSEEPPSSGLITAFPSDCAELSFKNDKGESLYKLSNDINPFKDGASFEAVAPEIRSPHLLGTALYSHFLQLTDKGAELFAPDNRSWFITALTRLKELTAPENALELSPLYKELEERREKLISLIAAYDRLVLVICPNLDNMYWLAFGDLEVEIFDLYCAIHRLARKSELLQARINRQEKLDEKEIDEQLEAEYKKFREQLKGMVNKVEEALEWKRKKRLNEDESKEFKKLYREIIKALHPDLHPALSERERQLFRQAAEAYEKGDLEELRTIKVMISLFQEPEESNEAPEVTLEKLKKRISETDAKIDNLKSIYPYIYLEVLEDPEHKARKRAEMESKSEEYRLTLDMYKKKVEELLRWSDE